MTDGRAGDRCTISMGFVDLLHTENNTPKPHATLAEHRHGLVTILLKDSFLGHQVAAGLSMYLFTSRSINVNVFSSLRLVAIQMQEQV